MRKFYLLFFVSLLIIACSDDKKIPKGILPQKKMQEVLWDMIGAGEFMNGYVINRDSVDRTAESGKIYGQVLQFHHITKEEFEKSYLYYREHPALMKVMLDSLAKRQVPAEELYNPKPDSTKIDSLKSDSARVDTTKHADTVLKMTDSVRHKILKPSRFKPKRDKRDSTRRRIIKKLTLPQ